ncbi:rRNA methyltransferase 1, mitochondrial [Tachyglossus aculeatus]|uniref:rRNA methyltransferase 1, mitochondrial n=1 Tax=Tachyglossus aculeatus TaxID=9261 RepID=UPI0018F716E9|nr:rRNA methyltransferase 1, mitochondrial [Tachyglossus aculeatus]
MILDSVESDALGAWKMIPGGMEGDPLTHGPPELMVPKLTAQPEAWKLPVPNRTTMALLPDRRRRPDAAHRAGVAAGPPGGLGAALVPSTSGASMVAARRGRRAAHSTGLAALGGGGRVAPRRWLSAGKAPSVPGGGRRWVPPWQRAREPEVRPGGAELRRLLEDDAPRGRERERLAAGTEALFGVAPCSLALLAARRAATRLFLNAPRPGLARLAEARGVPLRTVPRRVLDGLCGHRGHQGVCLEVTPLRPGSWARHGGQGEGDDGEKGRRGQRLCLLLDRIQDPRNLGALLRTAHFFGVDEVITSLTNSCPLSPVVSKASAGALEVLQVYGADDLPGLLKAKAAQGWMVAGTVDCSESRSPVLSCLDFRWDRPTVLVVGNEGSGLSAEVKDACQVLLNISPGWKITSGIESLNVSVAAGVILHSICSQRKSQ